MTILIGEDCVSPSSSTPIMYCDFLTTTPLQLSATPQLVTTFTDTVPPENVTRTLGAITWGKGGVVSLSLERIYRNNDSNPTNDAVYATIDVRKEGVSLFKRTLPLSTATSPTEPSISPFTSTGLRVVGEGDTFEIYISATDGVSAEPQDVELIFMRMAGTIVPSSL